MFDTPEEMLAHLLTGIAIELDLRDDLYEGMTSEYQAVGQWLVSQEAGGTSEWDVYSQGSVRLGVVVLPAIEGAEYDVDLVCRRGLLKQSVTQFELKQEVGDALKKFVVDHRERQGGPEGCEEGGRCWTLLYPSRRFHMDALPAIPDTDGSPTGILLTDRDLRMWQPSDPIGYANWFRLQMEPEFLRLRESMAKEARANVEDIPDWKVKTQLQRTVQVLKRHRDVFFANDRDAQPASIIVTTATALSYRPEENLFKAVVRAADEMPDQFETRDGVIWLANPMNPDENFADKWRSNPERHQKFLTWLDQLRRDLDQAAQTKGLPQVAAHLQTGFGEQAVSKAAEGLGKAFRQLGGTGSLTATAAGTLGTSGKKKVAQHSFYGEKRR